MLFAPLRRAFTSPIRRLSLLPRLSRYPPPQKLSLSPIRFSSITKPSLYLRPRPTPNTPILPRRPRSNRSALLPLPWRLRVPPASPKRPRRPASSLPTGPLPGLPPSSLRLPSPLHLPPLSRQLPRALRLQLPTPTNRLCCTTTTSTAATTQLLLSTGLPIWRQAPALSPPSVFKNMTRTFLRPFPNTKPI